MSDTKTPVKKWDPAPKFPLLLSVSLFDSLGRNVGERAFEIKEEQLTPLLLPEPSTATEQSVKEASRAILNVQMAAQLGAEHVIKELRGAVNG
jgi:hypothetical protein